MPQTIFTADRDVHRVREIRLNGKAISGVFYADTKSGVVKLYDTDGEPDGQDMKTKTLKGKVEVFLNDQGKGA